MQCSMCYMMARFCPPVVWTCDHLQHCSHWSLVVRCRLKQLAEKCRRFSAWKCILSWYADRFFGASWLIRNTWFISTGCCKTSVKLWEHIIETLYGVFFVFLGSFDCQIWAIFHFGTLWAYGWKKSLKIWPWKKARFQGWLKLANFLIS